MIYRLKISLTKSKLVKLDDRQISRDSNVLGCKVVKLLIKYLGIPLGAKHKKCKGVRPDCG